MNLLAVAATGLVRRLSARPVLPVRIVLGGIAGLGALLFTLRPVLMKEIWRRIVHQRDFKLALRRLAWYGRRSPLRLEIVRDPLFNFTEGLSARELGAVRSFIDNRAVAAIDRALDRLTLTAAETAEYMSPEVWRDIMTRFSGDADTVLQLLERSPVTKLRKDSLPVSRRAFTSNSARQALANFAALFPVDDLRWFVISGTFLGLVREGRFLDHDYDIDLGIDADDADLDLISNRISDSGTFSIRKVDYQKTLKPMSDGGCMVLSRPILLKLAHRNGISVDLFIHHRENGVHWHGSSVHRWENTPFGLSDYSLEGTAVLGPDDADRYLSENYGSWRIPVTDFKCYTGATNVRVAGNLSSIALFFRRLAFCRLNGDPAGQRIEDVMVESGVITRTGDSCRFSRALFSGTS